MTTTIYREGKKYDPTEIHGIIDKYSKQKIFDMASPETTLRELFENAGSGLKFSQVQSMVRKHNLPYKHATGTRPFKHLKALQGITTEGKTVKQIMAELDLDLLSSRDYCDVLNALKKNNLPFKQMKVNCVNRYAQELQEIDTNDLSIPEILEKLGLDRKNVNHYQNILHALKKFNLPYKRQARIKPNQHLAALLQMNTKDMTVKQIMAELDLDLLSNTAYCYILRALGRNNIPFKGMKPRKKK